MNKIKLLLIFLYFFIIVSCVVNESSTTEKDKLPADVKSCGNPYIGDYTIYWCDEFDYEGTPDNTKWKYDLGAGGWGNQELQHYTELERNAYVSDGYLTIAAHKEDYYGSDYTSARLVSIEKGSFLYDRVEIKARLPKGLGTWPALWMLPTEYTYGEWPNSGEIDIMEHVGYDEGTIHGTVHTARFNHMLGTQIGNSIRVSDATSEYHVYRVDWEPRKLIFYVDDVEYFTYDLDNINNIGNEIYDEWPFDKPFHIIMNIAIGGTWGGARGVDPNLDYADMSIDYVRVYQKDYSKNDKIAPSKPQIKHKEVITTPLMSNISWYPSFDNNYVK